MKKLHWWMLIVASCFAGASVRAEDEGAPLPVAKVTRAVQMYDAAGKTLPQKVDIEKGVVVVLQARSYSADSKDTEENISWYADPPSVVKIETSQNGTLARLTMKRDLFDDPNGLEPWTNVRACVRDVCRWVFVTGIINMAGKWEVDIDVTNTFLGIGSTTKTMNFVQTGRHLTITGVGKKPMTATIRGRDIDFVDPNKKLIKFSGSIRRGGADGTWASKAGYEGNWHAKR